MKLHLPHSLRAALVASWAFMITSQASAATYTIADASYSKVTPCCPEMGDWAFLSDVKATLSLYCYQPNQWHTYDGNGVRIHHAGDDLPVTLNLSGRGIDSYLVNLYDREHHAAWILSTRDTPSQVTLNDFQDISISYSHVSNVAGSGPAMGQLENSLYPFAGQATVTLNMVVDTADSFTFAYGDAYSGACFDNGGSTTINNVKNVNFKNNEATLFSESSLTISNVSGTATFDGNKGTVFKESEIVFYNVASLKFSNHESTIFKGSTTTFQECDSILVCSNTGATGSIADGGTCQFVECGSVIIDDNTCTEQELFTNAIPTFNNCDTVAITNNEGKAGTVIARLLNAEGIRDTFRVDNNLGYSKDADIEADSVLLGGNNVTYANAGKLTVKGQERKANLFSLSDNKGVGYYPHGFLDVGAWVSNFKTARFDGNGIQVANVKFAHLIGSLVLDNVDDISISGNTGYIATKSGGLIGATSEISKFNTLTIENNKLGADIGTKGWNPTMQDGFLSDAVITGKDSGSTEQSSVIVRSNTITGTASLPDDPIGDLAGVGRTSFTDISQVTISDNTFLASSAQAKVSATLFPTVSFSNIGHLAVQQNSGISNAGRAYGGAFGWMIDPASTAHYCFSADKVGNMEISGNAAIGKIGAYGGAIFADDGVSIHSCDAVTISGNYAQADSIADYLGTGWQDDFYTLMAGDEQYLYFGEGALGGGIFCAQDSTNIPHSLRIYNNKNFESRGNYVTDGSKYYLQGIAVVPYNSQNYEAYEAYLSAPQSASLAIYDAIFVGGDLNIGVDYDDFPELYFPEEQNRGRVLISGKYADEDLAAIKRKAGAGAVTQAELEASLSSKVQGSVRIEQGTLEVADNARLYVGDTLNLVGKGAVLKVSSGALVKSHYLNYFDDTNGCVWLNGGTLDIGYGDQQLMNTGMFVDAGNTLKVTAPSVIRTTRLTIASDGHVDLTVSAQNEKTPCLTLQFDGYFWSSEYSLGLGIGAEPFWRSASSPAYLSLGTSGVLDAGDYILIRVEGYDGSNVAVVQGCDWTKGEYVSGMNEKDSLSWVEDDYGANLVWTIGKTVTPPVNPDPEPEDPTPDNPPVGGDSLTWANAKKAVWQDGAAGWVEGGVFSAGDEVTFADGNVTIVGEVEPGEVTINTQKSLAFKTKYDKKKQQYSGAIAGETSVTIDAGPKAKVTMNDGNTYSGGTIIEGGSVKAGGATSFGTGAITLNGGTLDLAGKAVDNAIALEGAAIIKGGAKYTGDFSMGRGADLIKGSVVNISAGKTVTLGGGTINGTLSGLGSIEVAGDVELGATGKLTTGALAVESGTFSIGSKGLALSAKNSILTVNGGVVDSEGKLSTNELQMTGGEISIDTAKAMSLDIKGKTTSSLVDNGRISVAGKMSVAGNLELAGASSSIRLYDPSGKNKAMPLAVKGSLTLGSGSTLTLSGALSAKDMVLDGGTINLTGTKLATIKVGNSLTLNAATDINYNFAVTQKDVDKGKAFKILTFKSSNLQGQDVESLYNLLGLSEEYCTLVWDKKQTSLSLKVTDLEGWDEAKVSDEEAEATVPAAVAALVNPALPDYSGVADALVQANWGLVESSRAFVNTIANRSMAVQLGSGERAVWASAIAGSSRRSSSGTHGGADTNITGGAIGMETQLGENSLLGMALGNSWTRVSAHNYGTIKQDTTHLGIYGQTNWNKLSADWSAAYGRSESKFNGSDWSQRAIQLDGRLSYNHALSETVLLRGFGGVQYYASDSARVDGLDTGEVQNLRGEIGVGIVRSTYKSSVYAELALHQDLVRDNPEVRSPFGQRYHGTNPGRTGINLTIGGSYALSDQWSVNASYTAEVVENANAHSVNVGATYKF